MTAIGAPILVGAAGLATDYATFNNKLTTLQAAADSAAIAATRELSLAKSANAVIEDVARRYVVAALGDTEDEINVEVKVDKYGGAVSVIVTDHWQPMFGHFIGADITPVIADAKAKLVGESKICVIGLSSKGAGTIQMTKNSRL